jgi:flagellar biosynthesis/type III secretory pathway protein FliH
MKNIDCEKFIKMDTPDSLVLAILCDFKDKNPQDIVNFIIKRLHDKTESNEKEFRKYMIMLEELSTNRDLLEFIKKGEDMLTQINYEKLPSFYLGLEKGIERGIEQGIERGKLEGQLETALSLIKIMNLNPEDVSKNLNIPIDEIMSRLN